MSGASGPGTSVRKALSCSSTRPDRKVVSTEPPRAATSSRRAARSPLTMCSAGATTTSYAGEVGGHGDDVDVGAGLASAR